MAMLINLEASSEYQQSTPKPNGESMSQILNSN